MEQLQSGTLSQYEVGRAILRQVAQSTPSATAAASLYTPGDGVQSVVKRVYICNHSAGSAAWGMFHDDDGTTYTTATQLFKDQTLVAGSTLVLEDDLYLDSSGNLAVETDVEGAITFTAYAEETQVRASALAVAWL